MTARVDELDLRPGGNWRYVMLSPGGAESPQKGCTLRGAFFRGVVHTSPLYYTFASTTRGVLSRLAHSPMEPS